MMLNDQILLNGEYFALLHIIYLEFPYGIFSLVDMQVNLLYSKDFYLRDLHYLDMYCFFY